MSSSCQSRPNPEGCGGRLPMGTVRRRALVAHRAVSSSRGRRHMSEVHQALSSVVDWRRICAGCTGHLSRMCWLGTACEDRSLMLTQADGVNMTSRAFTPPDVDYTLVNAKGGARPDVTAVNATTTRRCMRCLQPMSKGVQARGGCPPGQHCNQHMPAAGVRAKQGPHA